MRRTLAEKLEYNRKKADTGDSFARGYCLGVTVYKRYPREDAEGKKIITDLINTVLAGLKLPEPSPYDRGIICGYRDAANDRKDK